MPIDKDIQDFVKSIGAVDPDDMKWKELFKRSNYLILDDLTLIVKISRSSKPFWGLTKKLLDYLLDQQYCVILLTSAKEGYFFTKQKVETYLGTKWPYRKENNNYKINHHTLPTKNSLRSPEDFLEKIAKNLKTSLGLLGNGNLKEIF